jgi:hypothetical protein
MGQGLSQSVARREALMEIGGLEQVGEKVRSVRAGHLVESLVGDFRYALRQLRRNRGFTALAALTLALGIGGTTAIFSVVKGILLEPLPYPHPERLVEVGLDLPAINQFSWPLSPAEYFTFREQSRSFEDIALYYTGFGGNLYSANVTGPGNLNTCRLSACRTECSKFWKSGPCWGVPLRGRTMSRAVRIQ